MGGFLIDENLPARLARELTSCGFPSLHVSDVPFLRAAPDEQILSHTARENMVLVTRDKELSFAARFPRAVQTGLVSVRIKEHVPIDEQVRIIVAALSTLGQQEFAGTVVVIEPGRVRIRRK